MLTTEELDAILPDLEFVKAWVQAVEDEVYRRLQDGEDFENAELAPGRKTRAWADEDEGLNWLRKDFPLKVVAPRKVLSIAQAEKVVGRGLIPDELIATKQSADRLVIRKRSH